MGKENRILIINGQGIGNHKVIAGENPKGNKEISLTDESSFGLQAIDIEGISAQG